jgi:hypothetical protein
VVGGTVGLLFHLLNTLQNFACLGFPIPRHANTPPPKKIPALLAWRRTLVHLKEGYSGFLEQASHQTDRDRISDTGSDQYIKIGIY